MTRFWGKRLRVARTGLSFKESALPFLACRMVTHYTGEVLGSNQSLLWLQEVLGKGLDIEPIGPLPFLFSQAIAQIIPIYVGDDTLHDLTFTQKRDVPPKVPLRGASGQRCYLWRSYTHCSMNPGFRQ